MNWKALIALSKFWGPLLSADRLNRDEWSVDSNGLPYLEDSESVAFCSVVKRLSYESHLVGLLQVNELQLKSELQDNPLLYGRGRYIKL